MNTGQAIHLGKILSKSSRPQNALYPGLVAALVAYVTAGSLVLSVQCYVIILLIYAIAAGYNNFHDVVTDKLNMRRDNPFTYHVVRFRIFGSFMAACAIAVCLLQAGLRQPFSIFCVLAYVSLLFSYSYPKIGLQNKGFAATVLLAICYGVLPLWLGMIQAEAIKVDQLVHLGVLQLLLLFPMLLAKDYKDEYGDALVGKRTPLVKYGNKVVWSSTAGLAVGGVLYYIFLALHYGQKPLHVVLLSTLYLYLIVMLHYRRGKLKKISSLLLTVVMLSIILPLIVIKQ